MLEPATPNEIPNRVQSPPPPVDVQGDLEYEISEVLDSKIDRRRSCKLLYLVRWLGYENTDEEFSWLPADRTGICVCTDIAISAYYFCILKILCTLY